MTAADIASSIAAAGPRGVSCRRNPACSHLHLDLAGLDQLRFYQPGDLTVGADAGMTVAALNAHLAPHQQFVPLDVPRPETTTLGAVLAQLLSGPLRQRFGTVRDFTIGLELSTAQGELVHCGGRVVKNVAGYDWMKTAFGARGAFGIITGVNFKVFPLPQEIEAARFAPLSWPEVESVRHRLLHSPLRPLSIELEAARGQRSVTVTFAGAAAVRARYRDELARFALPVEFLPTPPPAPPPPGPALAWPAAEAVAHLALLPPDTAITGRLGLGVFHVHGATPPPPSPATQQLMRALKLALDPGAIFHADACPPQ